MPWCKRCTAAIVVGVVAIVTVGRAAQFTVAGVVADGRITVGVVVAGDGTVVGRAAVGVGIVAGAVAAGKLYLPR